MILFLYLQKVLKSCAILHVDNMETGLYFDDEESMTDIHGLTYHYWTSSHTTYTVNVFANAISVRNDAKFDEYCTRRKVITSMSCFLKFVDISNIPNGTMIDIVMGNGAGEVVKAIRSFISKPPGKYGCILMFVRYIIRMPCLNLPIIIK